MYKLKNFINMMQKVLTLKLHGKNLLLHWTWVCSPTSDHVTAWRYSVYQTTAKSINLKLRTWNQATAGGHYFKTANHFQNNHRTLYFKTKNTPNNYRQLKLVNLSLYYCKTVDLIPNNCKTYTYQLQRFRTSVITLKHIHLYKNPAESLCLKTAKKATHTHLAFIESQILTLQIVHQTTTESIS